MGAAGGVEEEDEEKSCYGGQLLLEDMKCKEKKKNSNSNSWLLPPGFRFHPTDEELVLYYLKRKILRRHIHLPSIVGDVDVYKWQPWELPALLTTTTTTTSSSRDEKQWYLFSPRDRKYPNGSRSNRATEFGYWKSTGKDRPITTQRSGRRTTVGNKKTLVYYHGRAPRGQRTDWVMHEYTLLLDDTDTTANYDCYALYKLFRKSGPGPKNGEDYGAPFQEEDWEDDDDIFNKRTPAPTTSKQVQVDTNATLPDYNLEQVLLKLSRELDVDHHSQVEEVVVQSDQLVGLSSRADATTSVQHTTNTWWEQGAGETSYQIAPSTSVVCAHESLETPEVTTSLIGCAGQGQIKTDEEFLEIADFGDPGSLLWSMEDNSNKVCLPNNDDNSNNVCLPNNDGLYDPYDDDYFDAEMYLAEALEPLDGPNLYLDGFGEENQAASHMITELWTHEQDFSVSAATTTEPNQVASTTSVSAASGHVLCNNGSFSDIGGGDAHQEPISDSWLSSALSALLDSVPSSPAIAAESPLISKALQRVSSFRTPGGAALVPNDAAAATGNGRRRRRRGGTNNRGFLFISFLVGLGAVFWVLTIGISVKIIKGIWSRLS